MDALAAASRRHSGRKDTRLSGHPRRTPRTEKLPIRNDAGRRACAPLAGVRLARPVVGAGDGALFGQAATYSDGAPTTEAQRSPTGTTSH